MPTQFAAQTQENGVWYVVCHACGTKDAVTTITPEMAPGEVDVVIGQAAHQHDVNAGHYDEKFGYR